MNHPTGLVKKSRRIGWKILYIIGVSVFLLLVGEITARIMGYRPWKPNVQTLKVSPEGRFFQDDSLLGYKGKPGHFDLLLQDSLQFGVTHDAQGWRITSSDTIENDTRPQIWIFGCSFTHGYGVEDEATYPWLVQSQLQKFKVKNFGMDGYSTYQNWLLLQDLLDSGQRPRMVILAYGAFHDQRNTANRYWHKALHGQQIAESLRYPFLRLDDQDVLKHHAGKIGYHPLPFQENLALLSLIEERWNQSEDEGLRSKYITQLLIQKMHNLTLNADASFVLAGIYRHPDTEKMLHLFKLQQVPTVDISEDLEPTVMRILKGNGHPNALALQKIATKLTNFLTENPQLLETSDE